MINVDVRSNVDQVLAEFRQGTRGLQEKATVRALNTALDRSATEANRRIREVYNIKARAVAASFKKKRAAGGSRLANATLTIRGARIPLIEFAARWTRKTPTGASVMIKRGEGRKRIAGAFIGVHGKTGARQVFVRVGKKRYPIKSLRSISLPQAFVEKTVLEAVQAKAAATFRSEFERQLTHLMPKG